jgi:hypothetical protein
MFFALRVTSVLLWVTLFAACLGAPLVRAPDDPGSGDPSTSPNRMPTPPVNAVHCVAPRHYTFSRKDTVAIPCGGVDLFTETIPDEGHALARVTASISNPSTDNYEPYYDLSITVGNGWIPFTTGQDLCPGVTLSRRTQLGYGLLGNANQVTVSATQGAASCIDGRVTMSNVILDVWVEDPSPECEGKDVQLLSTFGTADAVDTSLHVVDTSLTPLLSLLVPPSDGDRQGILLLGAVEFSPHSLGYTTPYACGQPPTLSLSSQLGTGAGMVASDEDVAQAFQSMGHVTLGPAVALPYDGTLHAVTLYGQSGFPISIPVEVGGLAGGDAKLGFVKQ